MWSNPKITIFFFLEKLKQNFRNDIKLVSRVFFLFIKKNFPSYSISLYVFLYVCIIDLDVKRWYHRDSQTRRLNIFEFLLLLLFLYIEKPLTLPLPHTHTHTLTLVYRVYDTLASVCDVCCVCFANWKWKQK